jgi:hypothetical protein
MTTFASGWFGTDLGPYRACGGTYDLFPADSLPPLPPLDGSFGWLPTLEGGMEYMDPAPGLTVDGIGVALPPSFVSFMARPEWRAAIPSCTACYWSLSAAVPSPVGDGAHLVRFLNDQQDVLFWWLYLRPDGGHQVVCGNIPYDSYQASAEQARADLVTVAPGFEEFVYRFWVENLAWFELNEMGRSLAELDPAVREYLSHYNGDS